MKEMASELEWHIAHDGGLDRSGINELNHALRRTLRSHGGDYAQPIELVNQHLTIRGRPAGAPDTSRTRYTPVDADQQPRVSEPYGPSSMHRNVKSPQAC